MTYVIILAGGSISNKLSFLRSRCPSPALIPVNTRSLAAYLIDFYSARKDCEITLAVNGEVAAEVEAELGGLNQKYRLQRLGQTAGVVESLADALAEVPENADVIVNLVTTIPTKLPEPDEIFLASQASRSSHWSGVIVKDGKMKFSYKSAPLSEPSQAFTGVFRCNSTRLKTAVASTSNKTDLLAVVAELHARHPLHFTTCEWIDCGHETNYYEAKAKLVSSRSFNRIRVSLDDGVLTKQSAHGEKLAHEIEYVKMLPAAIQVYYPRILDWSPARDGAIATAQMEYYGYPSVAEYFLYWELSPDNWRRLFSRLQTALRRFGGFPHSISQPAFLDFYLDKTIHRVGQYFAALPAALRQTLEADITVNGHSCRPFAALVPDLQRRLTVLYREKDFGIMHGDFCFNNILYDVPSGIVRLIDPRGSFGERCVGIYGDRKYDLAKLQHSAEQGYDFLVNGLFSLRQEGKKFEYRLGQRECGPLVAELSRELIAELGCRYAEIALLTSLLFLSMGPLHAEDPARQLALYVHGLKLLNTALEN